MSQEAQKKKNKVKDFSFEKYCKVITGLNNVIDKTETTYDNKRDKYVMYLKACINEHLKEKKDDTIRKQYLHKLLSLKKSVFKRYGDEYSEGLFGLYSEDDIILYDAQNENSLISFFINFLFLNHQVGKSLISKGVIVLNPEKNLVDSDDEKCDSLSIDDFTNSDQIVNLLLLKIYVNSKIQMFYTSLSGELLKSNRSVLKFYKVMAFFAICFPRLENQADFIGSLLFISGDVVFALARAYLKTKGILCENLTSQIASYNEGGKHIYHTEMLTEKDCDFLRDFFLILIQKFVEIVISGNENKDNKYWDDYISLFNAFANSDEGRAEEIEKNIPKNVKMNYLINVYFSDFLFFFVTNFSSVNYNENNEFEFKSDFKNFENFLKFVLSFISNNFRNVFNYWNFAMIYQRGNVIEKGKTEYYTKDKPNTYGLSLAMTMMLSKQFSINNYLPYIVNKECYSKAFQEVLLYIITTENKAENKFMRNYEDFVINFAKVVKKRGLLESKGDDRGLVIKIKEEFEKMKIEKEKYLTIFE